MSERKDIPFCPLMSVASDVDMVCTEGRCGWYIPTVKKCAVYILGFNALLNANSSQQTPKQRV